MNSSNPEKGKGCVLRVEPLVRSRRPREVKGDGSNDGLVMAVAGKIGAGDVAPALQLRAGGVVDEEDLGEAVVPLGAAQGRSGACGRRRHDDGGIGSGWGKEQRHMGGRKGEARVHPEVKGDLIDVWEVRMATAWRSAVWTRRVQPPSSL